MNFRGDKYSRLQSKSIFTVSTLVNKQYFSVSVNHLTEHHILTGKAGLMAGRMRRSATLKKFTDKQREPVEICATYLKNKAPYLKYDRYLEPGFTIATGIIEGVCRHLVKDRMDITGAKWRLTSAEAVLRLRALRNSNDFDEYWDFHEDCEYKQNHQTLYRDGEVPPTKLPQPSSGRGRLRVIK